VGRVLKIRDLHIAVPLALAPMVGLSHSALRSLVAEIGGAGLFFTEMLSAKRLPAENETVSPFLVRGSDEYPLFYQIFTSDEKETDAAVERLDLLDAQGIDVNLGCPAPQLKRMGAGQELFNQSSKVVAVINRLRSRTNLPLSVKIRLGETENSVNLLACCKLFEDLGVDLITIHARLNYEKFCRKPRWAMIAPIAEHLSIPVIANGGIFSVSDAKRCLEQSGAAGLMIGRGAARHPWLFRDIARELYNVESVSEALTGRTAYLRFTALLYERFRPEKRLGRLKQFTHYFAANYQFGHQLASAVQNSFSMEHANEIAMEFFGKAA
jgi:nifR3 family TIM-barrel protein